MAKKDKPIEQPSPEDETEFAGPVTPPQVPINPGLNKRLKEMMGDTDDSKSRTEKGRKMGMERLALNIKK